MTQRRKVYDPVRRKAVKALPEEEVRQALVRWLIDAVQVPANLIAVEYSLSALDACCRHRADIVVWEPAGKVGGLQPWLLAECKAPGIAIEDQVADQARRYAEKVKAAYVLLTNGKNTRTFLLREGRYAEIKTLPKYGS